MSGPDTRGWSRAASSRRLLLALLIIGPTILASGYMADILPHKGGTSLELAIVVVFAALFGWISVGFWASAVGLLTLSRRIDRFDLTMGLTPSPAGPTEPKEKSDGQAKPIPRTAILLPIAGEDVARVMAGIEATYRSLAATGDLDSFDFFILSDSADPDIWVEEEEAWAGLTDRLGTRARAGGRIFYRRRRIGLKRKSGNVADFCRRWGRNYAYMVVLDADSVMAGETLVNLVRLMNLHPRAGIVQTAPAPVGRETLLARVQQFAGHAYGPMFAAGLHFWQLGDSQFWGHNAIIRIAPFMAHCSLPRLPGPPPLGGDIMSHDFVEAALMRRAGWEVWLAYRLRGSYEELPPTLLFELKRDRRWAQGNLQHLRLLFTQGLFPAHRALFLNGAMSYVSALLWFLLLTLSSVEAVVEAVRQPVYFPQAHRLFPDWPVWQPKWALTLLATTAVILFLPKLLSLLLIVLRQRRARDFGGPVRLAASIAGEVVVSSLLAPIRMLFHSKFVFLTLIGRQAGWGSQQRDDRPTSWTEALRFHGGGTLLGAAWGGLLYLVNQPFFWWNSPIVVSLLLAAPLSVLTSLPQLGRLARRLGLFLIPQELSPPRELRWLEEGLRREEGIFLRPPGFVRAVVDPRTHRLHLALLGGQRTLMAGIVWRRQTLVDKALGQGPKGLSGREKKELLYDPRSLEELHRRVWETEDPAVARAWNLPA